MITPEKVEKNYATFVATVEKYDILTPKFMEVYGDYIKKAKFPSFNDDDETNPLNCEGAFVSIILKATKFAISLNSSLPKSKTYSPDEVVKKTFLYVILNNLEDDFDSTVYHLMSNGVVFETYSDVKKFRCFSNDNLTRFIGKALEIAKLEETM